MFAAKCYPFAPLELVTDLDEKLENFKDVVLGFNNSIKNRLETITYFEAEKQKI